jgi:hypothetical protein
MIKGAINSSSSFNLIHFETAFKIDIFIYNDEPHQRKALKEQFTIVQHERIQSTVLGPEFPDVQFFDHL